MSGDQNRFGDYFVDALIGEGGMGKVYRARQVKLDRWVALKVLPRARENKTFVERFYREARSAAKLVHPNIIQIYTVEDLDGIPFYAMEYIEGDDLEHILRRKDEPYTNDETIETIRCVTKALSLAAEHGIVHRDIKPANIMITRSGLVKVMDFGLAKGIDNSMTQAGLIVGTPSYMSPEQGAGKPVDGRSDIYSLGCVMYECLAGQAPFQAENVAALIYKHMYENPPSPVEIRPDANPELSNISLKMLAKSPADRYQTPRELLEALAKVPSNSSAAELTLATRAIAATQRRKEHPSTLNQTMITPDGFLGQAPKDGDSGVRAVPTSPVAAAVSEFPSSGPFRAAGSGPRPAIAGVTAAMPAAAQAAAAAATAQPVAAPVALAPTPAPAPVPAPVVPPPPQPAEFRIPSTTAFQRGASGKQAEALEGAARPPSSTLLNRNAIKALQPPDSRTPQPGAQPAANVATPSTVLFSSGASVASGASGRLTRPDSAVFRMPPRMDMFMRLPDNRWSYKNDQGRCLISEGLAAELPAAVGKSAALGDCLLCSNWNKRSGCAVALCLEMERQNRFKGLKLISEEALIWAGSGRFDRAVSLLDNYIKNFPDDPEGYRELARVYDRPDYHGKDKRRMIVLYQRFAELARAKGSFSPLEISRAEERAVSLTTAPADTRSGFHSAAEGIAFQCFYRAGIVTFGYGALTPERLIFARAGEVDPETGIAASDMGGAMGRATTIFRRFKSEQAKKDEQANVKKELTRLSDLPLEGLSADSAKVLVLDYGQMNSVEMSIDSAVKIYTVTIKSPSGTHQLLFTEGSSFKAEQAYELIRRQLAKLGKK